jgi:tetratricopeptide (TPR) repeat protein
MNLPPSGRNSRAPRSGPLLLSVLVALGACTSQPRTSASAPVRELVAEVAIERGEYRFASTAYRDAAAAGHDPAVAERAARVAFENGQPDVLEGISRDWLARDPNSEVARRFLGVALLELDRPQDAQVQFASLLRTAYPAPAAGLLALQESLATQEDTGAIAQMFEGFTRQFPTLPEAHYAHAAAALQASNSVAALASVSKALDLRPDWREAQWLEARARVAGGDCTRGLAESSALAAEASDTDRLMYGWLLTACNHSEQAQPLFEDLARGTHFRAEALEALAGIALDAGHYEEASTRYTEALATGRDTDTAMNGLALVADRRGDSPRAVRMYERVTTGSRAASAQLRAYRLLLDAGDADGAARMLDRFVVNSPDKIAITASRAQVLGDVGRAPDALALLGRAQAVYPEQTELRFARATVLERSGQLDPALKELRALVRERPHDAIAANALGYTLADHSQDLSYAERLIHQALGQRPDSAAIQDSMGWVLYRRGHAADALDWLQRAYARDPDPEVAAHLGEVQWTLGDQHAALSTWRGALARAPGNAEVLAALARRGASATPAAGEASATQPQ